MMGRREGGQSQFFYAFELDKVAPPDHLVRQIDAVLDLRGAAHGHSTGSATAHQARMPCPTNGRTLRGVGVATHDRKASTPRLPQRAAEKAKAKIPVTTMPATKWAFATHSGANRKNICSLRNLPFPSRGLAQSGHRGPGEPSHHHLRNSGNWINRYSRYRVGAYLGGQICVASSVLLCSS
jgi:hypothetical protein